jgi:hypothetical protein
LPVLIMNPHREIASTSIAMTLSSPPIICYQTTPNVLLLLVVSKMKVFDKSAGLKLGTSLASLYIFERIPDSHRSMKTCCYFVKVLYVALIVSTYSQIWSSLGIVTYRVPVTLECIWLYQCWQLPRFQRKTCPRNATSIANKLRFFGFSF